MYIGAVDWATRETHR